jgi:hypothetical protein
MRLWAVCGVAAIAGGLATACNTAPQASLQRLLDARRLAAELLVQFTKAADAANRAVMADTDETSIAFAHEAEQATQGVQMNADALKPILEGLGYADETRVLEEFQGRFSEYRALDRTILDMAVENTNLKAQRLSFGPAQEAAEAFRESLEAIARVAPGDNAWRSRAEVATAVAAVREIQVLQAPHIAEADDAAMTRMEGRMAAEEAAARGTLKTLATIVRPESRPQLAAATAALDRFMGLNGEIVALSRRNTNVRSLALSLGQKRKLAAACEQSLRALVDALAARGFTATR